MTGSKAPFLGSFCRTGRPIVADDDKNEIALESCETQIRQDIYAGNIVTGSLD